MTIESLWVQLNLGPVVAREKISAASAGDFIVVRFALIGSLGVAT
jgi:hypothetical protein